MTSAASVLDEQREVVGTELRDLLRRGVASRTAPWSAGQRALVIDAADETLGVSAGSADGAPERGRC